MRVFVVTLFNKPSFVGAHQGSHARTRFLEGFSKVFCRLFLEGILRHFKGFVKGVLILRGLLKVARRHHA